MTFQCVVCLDPECDGLNWSKCTTQSNNVCSTCVESYLVSQVEANRINGDGSISCICSSLLCSGKFEKNEIMNNVKDSAIVEKYERFAADAAIEHDPTKKWCPRPGCNSVATMLSSKRAKCDTCNLKFCAKCGVNHSAMLDCSMGMGRDFRQYKRSTSQGCKRCPKCRLYIEKNGGCRHMTCVHCGEDFCWKCKKPFSQCQSGPICKTLGVLKHPIWGTNSLERAVVKTVALPVGCALLGVATGCAVAVGATVLTVAGLPLAVKSGYDFYVRRQVDSRFSRDLYPYEASNEAYDYPRQRKTSFDYGGEFDVGLDMLSEDLQQSILDSFPSPTDDKKEKSVVYDLERDYIGTLSYDEIGRPNVDCPYAFELLTAVAGNRYEA